MKRKLYILLLFLLVAASGKAQDFAPRLEAQNQTERKNVTVDYATGLFHYTVPIYRLKSGNYELPISLDYIGKGVKVNDPSGLIGYNWSLNIGGIVTRTMRGGFADEKPGYGYLWTENYITPLEQDARTVGLRRRDGESDIFTVVFNGKKVDFIIRMNKDRHIYALPLGQTDVRIECEGTSTEITGWIITDNNGDRYIYRQIEKCTDVRYLSVSTSNCLSDSDYISAWHLTRILPYNGAPIDFCYKDDVAGLYESDLPSSCINTTEIYDPYKMTYHYGTSVKEQPFDFEQYRSQFNYAIESARRYLEMCSLQMRFEYTDSKIRNFIKYGQMNIEHLLYEYVKSNNRIVGILSDISKISSASKELEENLRGLVAYCKTLHNSNADMAAMYLREAADYVEACLSEVRYVKTKEIWGGSSCRIISPFLSMIIFPEYVVKFDYFSSSPHLSTIGLYNRKMELLSSVSSGKGVMLSTQLYFFDKDGKRTSGLKFNYYEESDFPAWKKTGKDWWGYPFAQDEEEEYENYNIYASLNSLKSIVLSDGGKIEIGYEGNDMKKGPVGGIRLKSLIFTDKLDEHSDTISYGYPGKGISVYKSFSNMVKVTYPTVEDIIEYDRVQPEGHPVVNMGNNGFYYPYVTETISGKGTTVYHYKIAFPSLITDYPYWQNGLLTEKSIYDTHGKILRKIQYNYKVDVESEGSLPQMQPSNFYLDGKSLESFYRGQGTPYLRGEEIYKQNIEPRLSPINTDKFYNLHYGWKTLLQEEVEYRNEKDIPYCQTKYCYDNPASMQPTRIIRIGSDGVERTEIMKRVTDMADYTDSVFVKMREMNLLLPVVKTQTLIDGKLVGEKVYRYQADKNSKIGVIVPVEVLTYIPDTPEVYVQATIDTLVFNHGENNYITETSYRYASQKTIRMWVEAIGRTDQKSRTYDDYGKLLLECDAIGTTASDKYKGGGNTINEEELGTAMRNLKRKQQIFKSAIEVLKEEVDDERFLNFLDSQDHFFVASFAEEILKINQDLNQAKFYYECIVSDNHAIFNLFKQEYERMIELYPDFEILKQFISAMETIIAFDELAFFDYFYLLHDEMEKYSHGFTYLPELTPSPYTQNLRLYILDGNETASGSITYSGVNTSYTVKSISSSKLKIYNIDLSKYADISSVTANRQGSYMALVPEGANFKATSYNADGTVYARFDQSGNVEYYTYDAAGRVIKVEDQDGNILKTYDYNQVTNE